ncbi:uncharacterized protein TM35_000381160 [Trypanosoma theileri]|uniref:Uncharacterized protein n=1 Tax=Trypanosoma theileri TaxID=67003 RepID=A0A1X0NKC1_9TRYP|nr:uncharacterized protein TM35_000381160 [Trypanosoma theileri]ORC85041.1 hypothetical protein TM35_000381160 [Trypanosoma theileri]
MALVPSCSGIYFPEPPMDNILTLAWKNKEGDVPGPYSCVVYKVKCSAPQLFYVIPRYGALLVSDGSGKSLRPCAVNITFGLRPTTGDAPSEVTMSTLPPQRRPSTSVALSAGSHQERFAIEYFLISGDRPTYERLAQVLAAESGLTEVVRDVWEHISSTAPRTTPINLKVFMSGVTMDNSKADSGMIVVPPEAKLTRPSLHEHMMRRASGSSHTRDNNASHSVPRVSERSKSGGASELRALKLGIDALRHEYTTPGATSARVPDMSGAVGMTSASSNNVITCNSNGNGLYPPPGDTGADMIMRIPEGNNDFIKQKKDGLPLIYVLAAMFGTYVISMLFWRRGSDNHNSISVGQI